MLSPFSDEAVALLAQGKLTQSTFLGWYVLENQVRTERYGQFSAPTAAAARAASAEATRRLLLLPLK